MSRRLVITILTLLILGIIGGTIVLLANRFRNGSALDESGLSGTGQLQESGLGPQRIVDPTADDDSDGLINASESVWGTDLFNPDTDGDGVLDGDEVNGNRNPTIAGPNDVLPEGFQPGKDITPLSEAPIATDELFADNLDLSGGRENLTAKYKGAYSGTQRTTDTLLVFAQQQSIVTQLPTPQDSSILVAASETPQSISAYVSGVGGLSAFSDSMTYSEAVNDLFARNDPSTIRGMALVIRLYQEKLLEMSVPPSGLSLHKMLIGYSELLAATYDQMAMYVDDPVKGVVGVRQLEEIDKKYYPILQQELMNLRSTR